MAPTIRFLLLHLQMMQRMGWKGSGLGSEEAGITEPVRGGEVRDRRDQGRTGSIEGSLVDASRSVHFIVEATFSLSIVHRWLRRSHIGK